MRIGKHLPSRKISCFENLQDILLTAQNLFRKPQKKINKFSLIHFDKIIGALHCRRSYTVGFQALYLTPVDVMHHKTYIG